VDPHALGEILVGTRNLLRHHLRIGLRNYPERSRFTALLRGRSGSLATQERDEAPEKGVQPVALDIGEVWKAIRGCSTCPGRAHGPFLPGQDLVGPARLVIVGDWCRMTPPSDTCWCARDEDDMLWRMMKAIGERPDHVYITNVLKCPPGEAGDVAAAVRRCIVHLRREIAAVGAPVVLAMGEIAASALLGGGHPLIRMRGRLHKQVCEGRPVQIMPTFHPHFLLRHSEMKQAAWQDLLVVKKHLGKRR